MTFDSLELLCDVWREACRHIEVGQSAANLLGILQRQLPLARLDVLRLDAPKQLVESSTQGASDLPSGLPTAITCSPAQWRLLVSWVRQGQIVHGTKNKHLAVLEPLHPALSQADSLVGPLLVHEQPSGILVLTAAPGQRFLANHMRLAQRLLEPFSVALDNDHRFHELRALREAAEADRSSLLARLGRREIKDLVVGADTGLRNVMERVSLVAGSDVPVLILGDTGTGKEVIARAIHNRSPRSAGPFIRVNCGAIPPELIDSHLFGHEKGSFTGAAEQRRGWFERADRGTLFLDEIGELPLAAQVRLLRVLQDHQVERVGGQELIHVDVRIVAATHRDLAAMVQAGSFREDLWYRINVFPLLLPLLRERPEDIAPLARHFAERAAVRFGLTYVEPTPGDLKLLLDYSWPGNIRELAAVIDRAAILGNGRRLEVAAALGGDVPQHISLSPVPQGNLPSITGSPGEQATAITTLDTAMKAHIERALLVTRGQVEGLQGAAIMLGINPHTLRARMRKLGIDWTQFR